MVEQGVVYRMTRDVRGMETNCAAVKDMQGWCMDRLRRLSRRPLPPLSLLPLLLLLLLHHRH